MNTNSDTVVNGSVFTVESESPGRQVEPPPPYSLSEINTINNQQPIIHQTIILQSRLKDSPMFYNCPRCQDRVFTKVVYENSRSTHFMAGFICGITLWCLLCCLAAIPYYMNTFKRAHHYCPNCDTLLGSYSKL